MKNSKNNSLVQGLAKGKLLTAISNQAIKKAATAALKFYPKW